MALILSPDFISVQVQFAIVYMYISKRSLVKHRIDAKKWEGMIKERLGWKLAVNSKESNP